MLTSKHPSIQASKHPGKFCARPSASLGQARDLGFSAIGRVCGLVVHLRLWCCLDLPLGPQAGPKAHFHTFFIKLFKVWLVAPLGTVKFDEESIGDGFMSDG